VEWNDSDTAFKIARQDIERDEKWSVQRYRHSLAFSSTEASGPLFLREHPVVSEIYPQAIVAVM
jgi:hypothetical protein